MFLEALIGPPFYFLESVVKENFMVYSMLGGHSLFF